jgi:glycosyltransferase involved in cell wall biosynthesis
MRYLLISIIIPTFNRAHTLRRCLDSVIKQSFKDYEIILVDDGSTDETALIAKDYQNLRYLYQKNQGVSSARNLAIKEASFDWIALLDSDDQWQPKKLSNQVEFLKFNPDLLWCHSEEIWLRNGIRVNQMKKHQKSGGDQFERSCELCVISPSAVLFHRKLILEFGDFREDFPVCEDYDLWLKFSSKYPIGFINKPLVTKFGGHEDQLSRKFFAMDFYRVVSLHNAVKTLELSSAKKEKAISTIKSKLKILKKGYIKHDNDQGLQSIKAYLDTYQIS